MYPLYLWRESATPGRSCTRRESGSRHLSPAGPLGGIWDGLRAGWAGRRAARVRLAHARLLDGGRADTDPIRAAAINLENLAFLVLFVALTVVAWRRFGAPYGLFAAVSLAIPLSVPSERWPSLSIPRFGLTIFPFFLALAVIGRRPRAHTAILCVSSLLLGVAIVQWALWQWVA